MKYLHVFLDGSRSEEKELYAVSPENKSSTYSNLSKLECWQFEKSYCKSTTINIEWNFYRYKQWPKQRIPLKHYWTILYLKIAVPMMRTLCCRAGSPSFSLSGYLWLWTNLYFPNLVAPFFGSKMIIHIPGSPKAIQYMVFPQFQELLFKWFLTFTDIDTVKLEVIVHDL